MTIAASTIAPIAIAMPPRDLQQRAMLLVTTRAPGGPHIQEMHATGVVLIGYAARVIFERWQIKLRDRLADQRRWQNLLVATETGV